MSQTRQNKSAAQIIAEEEARVAAQDTDWSKDFDSKWKARAAKIRGGINTACNAIGLAPYYLGILFNKLNKLYGWKWSTLPPLGFLAKLILGPVYIAAKLICWAANVITYPLSLLLNLALQVANYVLNPLVKMFAKPIQALLDWKNGKYSGIAALEEVGIWAAKALIIIGLTFATLGIFAAFQGPITSFFTETVGPGINYFFSNIVGPFFSKIVGPFFTDIVGPAISAAAEFIGLKAFIGAIVALFVTPAACLAREHQLAKETEVTQTKTEKEGVTNRATTNTTAVPHTQASLYEDPRLVADRSVVPQQQPAPKSMMSAAESSSSLTAPPPNTTEVEVEVDDDEQKEQTTDRRHPPSS